MNYLAQVFSEYYEKLYEKLENKEFVEDKLMSGESRGTLVELIAPRITFDVEKAGEGFIDYNSRKSPRKYIEKEKEWYDSHDLSIDKVDDIQIWKDVSDDTSQINSNYGYLVFSKGNFSQFEQAFQSLKNFKSSRQSIIIYTRPSIHLESNALNGRDFICTNYQQFFIRDNKLNCVTSMRSNDCIYGTFNDIPWFITVYNRMYNRLLSPYNDLQKGEFIFVPNSWHCYEKHFDLLRDINKDIKEFKENNIKNLIEDLTKDTMKIIQEKLNDKNK